MAEDKPGTPAQLARQLNELWARQSKPRKLLATVVLVGVLGIVALTVLGDRDERWSVVADGASPDDAQELLATLEARDIPTRLRDGKVEVPRESVGRARAIAAAAGLPRTGKGFELFDGAHLGRSSFAEQVDYRRALQGELARSITALAQVQGARVHLALGRRSVFKDQEQAASASVALHLHAGQTLSAEQVRGVRQLVAASVEGLQADAVVVVDSHGNLLDGADPSASDRRAELERTLTTRVRSMLERIVGAGKVSVVTTAVVDDRKISETQELYDQTAPAVRSESRTIDGAEATSGIGGIAGTRGNLPGAPAASATPGSPPTGRVQETKNYEVSRTVRQTTKPDVALVKLHLAVVVDYKVGADGKAEPRSEAELAELAALARQAAGIDEGRGDKLELRAIPFAVESEAASASTPVVVAGRLPIVPIAIAAAAAIVLLAAVFLRRARRRKRPAPLSLALPAPVAELERVLEARASADLAARSEPELPGLPAGRPVRDRVLDAVRADAERAAEVLTAWLSEVPAKGVKP